MSKTSAPPNILIVMADHQRADTVLPEHPAVTPNLTRFVADSVAFTNAFCPSPHCCPSRATFFTGLYPSRHGVWNNVLNNQAIRHGLKPGVRCWSQDLVAAGYGLYFSGKWHVSSEESPASRGWTELFASATARNHHGVTWDEYRLRAQQAGPAARGQGQIMRPGYGTYTLYSQITDPIDSHDETAVAKVLEVLPELSRSSDPWCVYLGFIGPHDPYNVPGRFLDLYHLDEIPLPASAADPMSDKPRIYQRLRNQVFGQLSDSEVRDAIRHYWAFLSYLDSLFGKVLQALDATGQAENTLVLYCSDHGDYAGEHRLFCKGIPCFRGAYNIPALVRWPRGVTRPGRRVDAFVSTADAGPTLLDAAGLSWDSNLSGASLMPFLRGAQPAVWRDEIHTQCNGVELYYTQRSVSTQDYKYVFNGFDLDELYDLRRDPQETVNLAADPVYEPVKRELCRRLWRFACQEDDSVISPYVTVALAPYGPMMAFEDMSSSQTS